MQTWEGMGDPSGQDLSSDYTTQYHEVNSPISGIPYFLYSFLLLSTLIPSHNIFFPSYPQPWFTLFLFPPSPYSLLTRISPFLLLIHSFPLLLSYVSTCHSVLFFTFLSHQIPETALCSPHHLTASVATSTLPSPTWLLCASQPAEFFQLLSFLCYKFQPLQSLAPLFNPFCYLYRSKHVRSNIPLFLNITQCPLVQPISCCVLAPPQIHYRPFVWIKLHLYFSAQLDKLSISCSRILKLAPYCKTCIIIINTNTYELGAVGYSSPWACSATL